MSDDPLRDAETGQRWVVRVRLPDGSATDHTGWVDRMEPGVLALSRTDGSGVEVRRDLVIAARRAPAAAGGPSPRRVGAGRLEHLSRPGWLARSEPLGEWTLRSGAGFTGRANSAHAVGDPGRPLAEAAQAVIAYAAREQIPPRAQVVAGSVEEAGLRGLGWVETYVATDVLAVRLADFLGDRPIDPAVEVSETLGPDWWSAYHRSRPNDADPTVLRMILDGHPPRAFGAVPDPAAGGIISIARGHVSADWLGLASIWTADDHRRRGWATRIMVALGHWAARRGARYAYLQVAAANAPAQAAYARLGFAYHHRYLYLAPPP